MFRGRFTFTNEDQAPTTQQYQQQWQGGAAPIAPYQQQQQQGHSMLPWGQQQQLRHQAGDERYVRTVSFSETSTNDTSVSLQGAADRQSGNNKTLNLFVGAICAAAVLWAVAPLLTFALKILVGLVAFYVGYSALKGGLEKKGGGQSGSR